MAILSAANGDLGANLRHAKMSIDHRHHVVWMDSHRDFFNKKGESNCLDRLILQDMDVINLVRAAQDPPRRL